VQLRGSENLKGPELIIRNFQPVPVGCIYQPPINRIYATADFKNQKIDSAIFQRMVDCFSAAIRNEGGNLRTAWDSFPMPEQLTGWKVWHQGGCGLRVTAVWFDSKITFSTLVQQVCPHPTSAST
jgi:hypothetical protein